MEQNLSSEANTHSVKKFPSYYETRIFITVVTRAL